MDNNNKNIQIDASRWMRPKDLIKHLKKSKGIDVTPSAISYWIKQNKVKTRIIKELDNLLLVDIESVPKKVRAH